MAFSRKELRCRASSTPSYTTRVVGGRLGSINIVYAEAVIPIHAIWSAAVPILFTDLLFPDRRFGPYFGRLGRVLTGIWYLLGLALLTLLTRFSIAPGFFARRSLIAGSAAFALALIVAALLFPRRNPTPSFDGVPGFRTTFLGSTGIALIWHFLLAGLWRISPEFATWPLMLAPMLIAAMLLITGGWYVAAHVACRRWTPQHWFGVAAGTLLAHELFGILIFGSSWFPQIATLAVTSALLVTMYRETLKLDPTIRME